MKSSEVVVESPKFFNYVVLSIFAASFAKLESWYNKKTNLLMLYVDTTEFIYLHFKLIINSASIIKKTLSIWCGIQMNKQIYCLFLDRRFKLLSSFPIVNTLVNRQCKHKSFNATEGKFIEVVS